MPGKEEIMPINPISAEQLYFKPFKTLPSLVDGIIPKGMTVLAGSSKIGKSWMALDLAIAVASGGEFLGRHVRQAGVLYLCLEDTEKRRPICTSVLRVTGSAVASLEMSLKCCVSIPI